jgi:hypothetical protein
MHNMSQKNSVGTGAYAVVVGGCQRNGVHLLAELIHAQHVTKIQRGNRGVLEDVAMESSGSGSGATAH